MPRWLASVGLAALLAAPAMRAQEQAVAIKDAPVAVVQNVSARFPQAKIASVVRDTADGKQVYEVTLKQGGRTIDVTATPAGEVTLVEREISARQLPAAVAKLLRDKYPRATYKIVEEVRTISGSDATLSFYEVLLETQGKQRLEVQVAPDGSRILKVERKKRGEPNE